LGFINKSGRNDPGRNDSGGEQDSGRNDPVPFIHIILDICTQYTFNIFCKKKYNTYKIYAHEEAHHQALPKASPNSETPAKKIIIHSFWCTLIIYLLVVYKKNNNSFILVYFCQRSQAKLFLHCIYFKKTLIGRKRSWRVLFLVIHRYQGGIRRYQGGIRRYQRWD
jgi:hypothetical protein